MKTSLFNYKFFCTVLTVFSACTVKESNNIQTEVDEVVITASTEADTETKTTLDTDQTTVLWMPEESISIFKGGEMVKFTADNTEKAKTATFTGILPKNESGGNMLYGLYPFNPDATISKDIITTFLPPEQEGFPESFADELFISVSRTDSFEMGFRNACSGLRFMLDRNDITGVSLLTNDGEPIAGKVSIGFENDGTPFIANVIEGISEAKLYAPSGKFFESGVWYYLVTLPSSLVHGFTILFEGDAVQGAVRSTKPLSFNRNKFRSGKLNASHVDYKKESEYDIENAGIRSYLENEDYSDDPNYSRSEVSKYQGSDKPNPVRITWEGDAQTLRLSTSPDLSGYWDVNVSTSPALVYDLIPGVRYYYSILATDGTVLKESCVIPKGPIRMINGLNKNTRDLGGWKAGDKTIRYGKVYRGARLDDIQENASMKDFAINTLKIGVDLDLRGLPPGSQGGSGEKNPWKSTDPVLYKNIQVWNYFVASSNKYESFEVAPGKTADQYQYAIRCIIEWLKEGKVVYFHCHGGADRTGTLAFLLEALLGVSESDLSKDFELTTYANSTHRRNGDGGWFFKPMVKYIRSFAPGETIQEQVTAWAKTRHSDKVEPLTDEEIQTLKELMLK